MSTDHIQTLTELQNRIHVFRDRAHAGEILAGMLDDYHESDALVLGIPAGGLPVAAEVAIRLGLALDVMPVNKILFPWTTESGFGAVAFDGTQWINKQLGTHYRLDEEMIKTATEEAFRKVQRRLQRFRGEQPFPELADQTVILIDDGIAAGSTIRAGIMALQKAKTGKIIIATPTAHDTSLYAIAKLVDNVYCANIRSGLSFAVADAYQLWTDVSEDEVAGILGNFTNKTQSGC